MKCKWGVIDKACDSHTEGMHQVITIEDTVRDVWWHRSMRPWKRVRKLLLTAQSNVKTASGQTWFVPYKMVSISVLLFIRAALGWPQPLQLILVLLKFFCPFSFLSARCAWPIAEKNHHGSKERLVHQLVPTELADWDDSCGPIPDWTKAPTQLQAIARNMSPPRLLPDCIALKSTARVWVGTCSLLRHCKKRCLDPVGNQSLPQTSSNRVSAASHWPSSYALMAAL